MTPTRTRPRWLILAAVVLLAGASGCSDGPNTAMSPDPIASDDVEGEQAKVVQVHLGHADRGDPCDDVFPVDREVSAEAPLRGALQALLAGPTEDEAAAGYGSWFSAETEGMLNGVRLDDGTAHVDFADFSEVIPNASTSCGSALLLGQLDATVTQFDTVTEARYAFDGDQAAFYEWLQLAPPDDEPDD